MHDDTTTPDVRVVIDPEDAVVRIIGRGCCVVLDGTAQMREVRDALTSHINLLRTETACGHRQYADGRCGEMSCANYYGKHLPPDGRDEEVTR